MLTLCVIGIACSIPNRLNWFSRVAVQFGCGFAAAFIWHEQCSVTNPRQLVVVVQRKNQFEETKIQQSVSKV